ncbi:MAG: hypothetical protein P8123_07345, partial [bacterium]
MTYPLGRCEDLYLNRNAMRVAAALCCAASLMRFSIWVNFPPIPSPDTGSYECALQGGVFSHLFYQRRSSGYPLVLAAFGHNREHVVLFQRALGIFSWFCLGLACTRHIRLPAIQCLAALSIVGLGCSPMVV